LAANAGPGSGNPQPVDDDEAWRLRAGDLVVIDESAMTDTPALAAIHRHVDAASRAAITTGSRSAAPNCVQRRGIVPGELCAAQDPGERGGDVLSGNPPPILWGAVRRVPVLARGRRRRGRAPAHFTEQARHGGAEVRGPNQRRWLTWLAVERDNLQTALGWLTAHRDHDPDRGLQMVAALGWLWYFASRPDAWAQVEAMLAATVGGSPAARAAALLAAAVAGRPAACIVHPHAACAAAARQSLQLMTALGDEHGAAIAATLLAVEGIGGQDIPGSLRLLDHADEQLEASDDTWSQALVQFVRMELHFAAATPDEATRCGRRALAIYRRLADHWGCPRCSCTWASPCTAPAGCPPPTKPTKAR
jgi:hypothetical protein